MSLNSPPGFCHGVRVSHRYADAQLHFCAAFGHAPFSGAAWRQMKSSPEHWQNSASSFRSAIRRAWIATRSAPPSGCRRPAIRVPPIARSHMDIPTTRGHALRAVSTQGRGVGDLPRQAPAFHAGWCGNRGFLEDQIPASLHGLREFHRFTRNPDGRLFPSRWPTRPPRRMDGRRSERRVQRFLPRYAANAR
jgi:hypothetical protein